MSTKHKEIKLKAKTIVDLLKTSPEYDKEVSKTWTYDICKKETQKYFSKTESKKIRNKTVGLIYSKVTQKMDTIFQKYLNKLKKKKRKERLFS